MHVITLIVYLYMYKEHECLDLARVEKITFIQSKKTPHYQLTFDPRLSSASLRSRWTVGSEVTPGTLHTHGTLQNNRSISQYTAILIIYIFKYSWYTM